MDDKLIQHGIAMSMIAEKHRYYAESEPAQVCDDTEPPMNKEEARHQFRSRPLSHYEKLACQKQHGKRR